MTQSYAASTPDVVVEFIDVLELDEYHVVLELVPLVHEHCLPLLTLNDDCWHPCGGDGGVCVRC